MLYKICLISIRIAPHCTVFFQLVRMTTLSRNEASMNRPGADHANADFITLMN